MTREQFNTASYILAEIARLEHTLKDMQRDEIAIGYLFDEAEIKARKLAKIQDFKTQIQQLKKQFEEL